MTKHVIDKGHGTTGSRLSEYTKLERRERVNGQHEAVEALHRQPHPVDDAKLAQEFTRIERQSED